MNNQLRILLLEDNAMDAELIDRALRTGGVTYVSKCVSAKDEYLAALDAFKPDVVLSDHKLPDFSGVDAMAAALQRNPDLPFILVTGALGDESAVEMMRMGATDYILKHRLFQLVPAVQRATREAEHRSQSRQAEAKFRAVLEAAPDAMLMLDSQYRIVMLNLRAEKLFGYPRGELVGAEMSKLVPRLPFTSSNESNGSGSSLGADRAKETEIDLSAIRKDGSEFAVDVRISPFKTEQGMVLVAAVRDVSARRETERRLRESEERFRQLAENIKEVFWMSDPQKNRMLYISPGYEAIWGRSCASLYAEPRNWLEAIHPQDRDRVLQAALTKQISGEYNETYRIIQPDGSIRWIQDRAFPVRNWAGQVYRIVGLAEDITQRRLADAQMLTLAQAVQSTTEMICITDLDDRFIFVNRAFEATYGYFQSEILGQTPAILFSPNNPPGLMTEILQKTRSGGWQGEVLDRRKDGTDFPIVLSTSVVKDSSGQIIGLMGVAKEITERKKAEAQIRLLADAVQSSREIISITDEQNRFTFVNRAFLDTYGFEPAEVIGKTPHFLYAPSNPPGLCERILEQTLRDGSWSGELLNRRKDGTDLPIALSTSQIRGKDGALLGLIGVAADITERRRAERQAAAFGLLGHRLSAATTAEAAAKIIWSVASDLFTCDAGFVDLYSAPDNQMLPMLVVDILQGKRQPVPGGKFVRTPLMKRVMEQGPLIIHRGEESSIEARLEPFGDISRPSACRMYVPIHSGRAIVGILSVHSYTPLAYGEQDLALLQTLADFCGDALERIRVADSLRQAETNYRSIFENATEGIFRTTPEGCYLSANPALARMFGYQSPDELISSVTDIERQTYVVPQRREELKRLLELHEAVQGFEAERFRKDGTKFWITINGHVVRDSTGKILYYEGTNQEITERKLAESRLRESERKLRLIAENTSDAIFAFDMDRIPLYGNPAIEQLTGYTFAEVHARRFINWIHPEDEQRMLQLWESLFAGQPYSEVEFRLLTKSGQIKWCSSSWGPLYDENGLQIGVQGRERDITERKLLETQVLESTSDERRRIGHELHDCLGQFLAGVSLRAKALEQSLAAENHPKAAEANELAALSASAMSQARALARGLDPVEIENIGLPAALENLAVESEKLFQIVCKFHYQESESDLSLDARAALELFRITQEAIHNAVSHGNARRVDIVLTHDFAGLALRISDDGTGFDVDRIAPTGMGLRVMQYRANSIGARFKISSQPGQGTEISCFLPLS